MRLCRSSETALSLPGVCSFCSVTPVAAHPLGEVAIVVLVVIHHESRQEPEGHDSPVGVFLSLSRLGSPHTELQHVSRSYCCKSDQSGASMWERESSTSWPTEPPTDWLLYCTAQSHNTKSLHSDVYRNSKAVALCGCILRWAKYRMQSFCFSL